MLVQGMVGSVTCVAAHPQLPRLIILCESGDVHLWDYNLKARGSSTSVRSGCGSMSVWYWWIPPGFRRSRCC